VFWGRAPRQQAEEEARRRAEDDKTMALAARVQELERSLALNTPAVEKKDDAIPDALRETVKDLFTGTKKDST
jgi:hypothetical protein